jgi:hypothetical protein
VICDRVRRMRALLLSLALLVLTLSTSAANLTGTYKGTWSGNSGGGDFAITLDSQDSAHPKAEISFSVSGQDVKATVTSVTVNGSKMNVVYKFEIDGTELQSTVNGELEGKTLQGRYETKALADGSEVDSGTWKASSGAAAGPH